MIEEVEWQIGAVEKPSAINCNKMLEVIKQLQGQVKNNDSLHSVSQQSELLKKWWKFFDEESIAVNCNDKERETVINEFFNCG